ncbi:PepSY domain-containing protein [Streptosporangium sp. KLBMP 9127]|nr:PepSY domain-containing protein [Streptosporangium sp. KLBMP 9127]
MNLEQARAIAEEYFNGVRPLDDAHEVSVYSFKDGYVAWAKEDEPDDPSVLPTVVGGGCVVIDAATGEIMIRPLLSPETVADQWPGRRPR